MNEQSGVIEVEGINDEKDYSMVRNLTHVFAFLAASCEADEDENLTFYFFCHA